MLDTISTLLFCLMFACIIAIPVLSVVFIVMWIMKQKKMWYGVAVVFCVIGVVAFAIGGGITSEMAMTPEERAERDARLEAEAAERLAAEERITEKSETEITSQETETNLPPMIEQFMTLGFTESEASEMKEIFETVGITEISNIQGIGDASIDNLKAFTCDIFDYRADKGGISAHFTIDKRQLCYISIDGIPTSKLDYAYINIFGNVKYKTSNSVASVTMYDVWDEEGEIIPDAIGYKAVFDYENNKITSYE